jgi:hypothetical protein
MSTEVDFTMALGWYVSQCADDYGASAETSHRLTDALKALIRDVIAEAKADAR